jgi:hypothetical protein
MTLQDSITELQENVADLYAKLETRFTENQLIKDLWTAMSHDISHQILTMKALPSSFWKQIKGEGLAETIAHIQRFKGIEKIEDLSLRSSLELALSAEQSTILKAYVPIIRLLRKNWTDKSLDFYIMVKAHLARITRVTQSFSGDPSIIQRAQLVFNNFDKEVQTIESALKSTKPSPEHPAPEKKYIQKSQAEAKPSHTVPKHVQTHHKHAKPLAEKLNLQRRRARG